MDTKNKFCTKPKVQSLALHELQGLLCSWDLRPGEAEAGATRAWGQLQQSKAILTKVWCGTLHMFIKEYNILVNCESRNLQTASEPSHKNPSYHAAPHSSYALKEEQSPWAQAPKPQGNLIQNLTKGGQRSQIWWHTPLIKTGFEFKANLVQ